MSHADVVIKLAKGFKVVANTKNSKFAIVENKKKKSMVFNSIPK